MLTFLNDLLNQFNTTDLSGQKIFSRTATYKWFVIIILGLMVRTDLLGVTSIVRGLLLVTGSYECICHFFRSDAWSLERLNNKWIEIISKSNCLARTAGRTVILGDGIKRAHDGRFVPCTKKLLQSSGSSSKAGDYIHGHLLGALSVLVRSKTEPTLCHSFLDFRTETK